MTSGLSLRLPKRGLSLNEEYHLHNFDESNVADIFSYSDLQTKISSALEKNGLHDLSYEFAVSDKKGKIELMSKKFEEAYTDDINSLQTRVTVMPQDVIEPVGPFETIIIIVPNVRFYLLKTLRWVIVGAVLFVLIVFTAFLSL